MLKHTRTYERELAQSTGKDSPMPIKSCVSKLIKKWHNTGSMLDKSDSARK